MTLHLQAMCYLTSWDRGEPLPGGMHHEALLREHRLDYSVDSLDRIDAFLDTVRLTHRPDRQRFFSDLASTNIITLLAFYVAELIGRSHGRAPVLLTHEEAIAIDAGNRMLGDGYTTMIICRFPGTQARIDFFCPLYAIGERLLDEHSGKSIRLSVDSCLNAEYRKPQNTSKPLPPIPPQRLEIATAAALHPGPLDDASELRMTRPGWVDGDDLKRLFDHEALLLEEGRAVWATIVQANTRLFEPSFFGGAPGEVIYDPQGRLPAEDLFGIGRKLMSLKGQAPQDEEMRRYGDHLKNEMTRDFGRPVPRALLPYPLTVSTTYFDQMHLPDGMLTNAKVPVLISDHCPGVVMPVPCRFWPDDFRREWMDASEQRFGRRHEARQLREQFRTARTRAAAAAVPREQQAARLHEDGMRHLRGEGVEPDAKKAARLLEQAARLGHLASMHEYAVLCEQGRGVGQDAGSALAWYGQAAERDFTPAQLGLGRLHLQADGIAPDRDKARHWLGMAAAAGSDEARQLLRDAGLDGNAVQRALRKFFS